MKFLITLHAAANIGASIDESIITHTVTVDPEGNGDYTELSDALLFSRLGNRQVRIILEPGIYRQGELRITSNSNLTIIEGRSPGSVVFTGADVWEDWEIEGNGVYSKEWNFDWGLAEYDPFLFEIDGNIGKRSEIVLYNGDRLLHVESYVDLIPGSYAVDEELNKIYLVPPEGGDLQSDTVEVATRNFFLYSFGKDNLVLRNLIVENYASGNQHGSSGTWTCLIVGRSEEDRAINILIDNCTFRGNNAGGLTLSILDGISLYNSNFIYNGVSGASLSRSKNVLIDQCSFNYNNWRMGGYGNFYGWAPAGIKLLQVGIGLIQNSDFSDNLAAGLWLDTGIEEFLVRDCTMNNNYEAGLDIENNYGPVLVENNVITNNGLFAEKQEGANQGGLLIAESRNVIAIGNVIEDNSHGQILIRTRDRFDELAGYISETAFDGFVEDITFLYNRIKGKSIFPPIPDPRVAKVGLIQSTIYSTPEKYDEEFLPTLYSDFNSYYHESELDVFSDGFSFGFDKVSLESWNSDYGLDLNSSWEELSTIPETLPSANLLERFGRRSFKEGVSYISEWFGSFWDMGLGWVYQESIGYVYVGELPRFDEWLWAQDIGHFWASEGVYPFVFLNSEGWAYIADFGDSVWLYRYESDSWMMLL